MRLAPGLMDMGGDSSLRGHEFEFHQWILDGDGPLFAFKYLLQNFKASTFRGKHRCLKPIAKVIDTIIVILNR